MTIADRGERGAQPQSRVAAAIFGDDQHIGLVLRQYGGDRGQSRPAALPDVPGEEAQGHQSAEPRGAARPLISAPASGDMSRKNGTDSSEMPATIASAMEKSAALDTAVPVDARIKSSHIAPVPTPTLSARS